MVANKEQFLIDFANQFEDVEVSNIHEAVDFKSLDTWDSLTAMSVQVMIEDNYKVKVLPPDFKVVVTPLDLYKLVISRMTK